LIRLLSDNPEKTTYTPDEIENALIWGDAFQVLPKFPSELADMIFIDPPYFVHRSKYPIRRWGEKTTLYIWDEEWDEFEDFEHYDGFITALLAECMRIMKPNATIWVMGSFQNICRVGRIMQDLGFWFLTIFVWEKTNPTPNFLYRRPSNATEFLIWAVKDKSVKDYVYNYEYAKLSVPPRFKIPVNIWEFPICNSNVSERLKDEEGKPLHPTQKPEALLERVILISTREGDLILDPMCGTGTTGAVALRHNRRFVMVEKEKKYVDAAYERLKNSLPQPSIFD
jgi:DNA modification methylase